VNGQRLALADDDESGGSVLLVAKLVFDVQILGGGAVQPPFLPFMQSADVSLPAIQQMLGTVDGAAPPATTMRHHLGYLARGFIGDGKQFFATFDTPLPPLTIPAERGGGLTTPQFPKPDGLSRLMGPVSNVKDAVEIISPQDLVGPAKLLGNIALSDVIGSISAAAPPFLGQNPAGIFDTIDIPGNLLPRPLLTTVTSGTGVETRFVWKPPLKTTGLPAPLAPLAGSAMELVIKGRVVSRFSAAGTIATDPVFEINGRLSNFSLQLGLLNVDFDSLEFHSAGGQKMDLSTHIRAISFGDGLSFVKTIQQLLPVGSLGAAPQIQPQPDGVLIRYALAIPAFPAAGFSILNVALVSTVSLPFTAGRPVAVRFSLSERGNPFLVSVAPFGGTGFFAIEVRTDKTVLVEAAIEFGGVLSLNLLGIVSGGVYLLAGIYLSKTDSDLAITGQLRLGGYVDVLGLVSVAIEVYVALTYDSHSGTLSGTGRLTVSVKVFFFSQSFSFEVHKEIAGFGPVMAERAVHALARASLGVHTQAIGAISAQQWQTYCAAFA
jgi:hypothetical protein